MRLRKAKSAEETDRGARPRSRVARLVAAPLIGAGVLIGSMAVGVQPASAHARCDGASHRDWHWAEFHNDYHYYWKTVRVNRTTVAVYFKNNRHPDHTYTVFCRG